MAPIAMASFPLTNIFSVSVRVTLPPHTNCNIRANLTTEGTPRASLVIIPNHKEVSLTVNLLSNPNQFFGARDRTKSTTLTAFAINFNLRHIR